MPVKNDSRNGDVKYHLWGWMLFLLCAVLFAASGIKNGDMLTLAGSIVFFLACLFFIFPLMRRRKRER